MPGAITKIDRIAQLLAQGVPASSTASIVGVDASYISQLYSDPDFKDYVNNLKLEAADQAITEKEELANYTDRLLGTEHRIIDTLLERIAYMPDNLVIAALREVGNRHDNMRKHSANGLINGAIGSAMGQPGANIRVVEITIPTAAVPDIIYGPNQEIVKIGNRAIAPMSTNTLQTLITNMDKPSLESLDFEEVPDHAQAINF